MKPLARMQEESDESLAMSEKSPDSRDRVAQNFLPKNIFDGQNPESAKNSNCFRQPAKSGAKKHCYLTA
jgi:hypothetical protein